MTNLYDLRGDVAVITIDNPPVNSLGLAVRTRIMQALAAAQDDSAVAAIVLTGTARGFSGGADITELGTPRAFAEPNLRTLNALLEDGPKPVVAAVSGTCMGGGLELALACHYRIVAPGTAVGLPEVRIGLIPGAGGTQRLPRVLGVETALNMILDGRPVPGEVLAAEPGQRLFDAVAKGDLLEEAVAFAHGRAAVRPLPRVRDLALSHPDADGYFQFVRNMTAPRAGALEAPGQCIEAVARATRLGFEQGLAEEARAFAALADSAQSKALRHAFLAERAAAKVPGVPGDSAAREVRRVAVVGAGTMGSGIATSLLEAGLPVLLLDADRGALDRGVATIRRTWQAQVDRRKVAPDRLEARMALLSTVQSFADIADADLVIEAVFEDLAVKETVFRALDEALKPGAILASNTSTLDLDRIAAFTRRPADVVGMHFFSPANVMKLLEIVRGRETAPEVLATAMRIGRRLGKTCVVSGVCDGFIGNRMIEQYLRQAGFLLDEGASPQQVDRAIEAFGLAMGPFRMSDLAGNDIPWAIRKRRRAEGSSRRESASADLLCEMGRFGQKTGGGWYDYTPGQRAASPSPAVEDMLRAHRERLGIAPRAIGDEEIRERLLYALANEGARIVEEGIALRASDIDVVYLAGYGFPAHRGGPMHHVEAAGLPRVLASMKRFAANPRDDAAFWQPARWLADRAGAATMEQTP